MRPSERDHRFRLAGAFRFPDRLRVTSPSPSAPCGSPLSTGPRSGGGSEVQTPKPSSPSKTERTFVVLIQHIVPIVFSVLLPIQMPREPPGDFGFRFRYGVCLTDELDTFAGWFTRDLPDGTSAMAQLSLNASQMRHLYEKVTQIDFFNYPSVFGGDQRRPPQFTKGLQFVIKYQMDVRSGGRTHSVQWDDDQTETGPQADGLRRLFSWAVTFIINAPEVTRLPQSTEPCDRAG
jgi:hypothetical protein